MQAEPMIDSRSGQDIFQRLARDLKDRLGVDAAAGDPLAEALLRVFSRYCELIIQRLNRVPDKNHIAFLDILNVSRIPPAPAQVALTFSPVKKLPKEFSRTRHSIGVPAYTKVAAAPGEGESEPTVFETVRDLTLTNIELKKILALDPQEDRYTDKSSLATPEGGSGEFAFDARQPVVHEFYIGFGPTWGAPGISELRLRFDIDSRISGGSSQRGTGWWMPTPQGEISLTPARDTTSELTQNGEVIFKNLPEWPRREIFGRELYWLGCRWLDRLQRSTEAALPWVRSVTISATWEAEESVIDHAFFNGLPLDLSKDFFPLGERPRFGDVFYLSCNALAKPHANTSLKIKLTNPASAGDAAPIPPVSKNGQPKMQWEYWDGRRWTILACNDGTEALTEDGEIFFLAPTPFPPTMVNGLEGFWLRARLVSGSYGDEERFELTSPSQELRRILTTLAPPSIQSITVTSSFTIGPEHPETILTHNGLMFEQVDGTVPFQPFRVALEPHRALYLGFKALDDDKNAFADRPIDLYFHISGSGERASIRDAALHGLPVLMWQYWNGTDWTEASVVDSTESLTKPGTVRVQSGQDIVLWRESSFCRSLYWLRVLWISGEFEGLPKLRRLLLNTVLATQTFTLQNELLGSSNGLPNQIVRAARVPILRDVQLEVQEPDMPAGEELAWVYREEGEDALTIIREPQGRIQKIWVRWHEVNDFLSSSNRDRHFTVDRQSGEICFGDGRKGLIPAVGANNVRLRTYQTGGGAFGNKPARSITQLRTSVPYVDSVTNLDPALGGQDIEDWDSVRERGAHWLRHRSRVVTMEDYEDLAKLASPAVAKTKCYPNRDLAKDPAGRSIKAGVVSLIVVPHSEDPRPLPELTLLRQIGNFLQERRAPDVELVLLAPAYVRISVEAVVSTAAAHTGMSIVQHCYEVLDRYLHPLTGGLDGKGWKFGKRPYESDVYALLESIRGLDHVHSLLISMEEEYPDLLESENFLICAGEHSIRLG
jgi:Baseplate J-like protein